MIELPSIMTCTSDFESYDIDSFTCDTVEGASGSIGPRGAAGPKGTVGPMKFAGNLLAAHRPQQSESITPMSNRRIVQIYIADPNESIPLEKSLLFQDEKPHLTDLTDQELFFEIDMKNILDKHNEYRVTVKDKEASEGKASDVMLEKAKIRDLRMTVVVVASF